MVVTTMVLIVERESKRDGKEKKGMGFRCFHSETGFPNTVLSISVYRKLNYLFEMNRFQDTMEITSIVQLGN